MELWTECSLVYMQAAPRGVFETRGLGCCCSCAQFSKLSLETSQLSCQSRPSSTELAVSSRSGPPTAPVHATVRPSSPYLPARTVSAVYRRCRLRPWTVLRRSVFSVDCEATHTSAAPAPDDMAATMATRAMPSIDQVQNGRRRRGEAGVRCQLLTRSVRRQ